MFQNGIMATSLGPSRLWMIPHYIAVQHITIVSRKSENARELAVVFFIYKCQILEWLSFLYTIVLMLLLLTWICQTLCAVLLVVRLLFPLQETTTARLFLDCGFISSFIYLYPLHTRISLIRDNTLG